MIDPRKTAKHAGLRYVTDQSPGYHRQKRGKGFVFTDLRGHPIKSPAKLKRFKDLVIPPAWQDVWICPDSEGHLQVTGHDARGRKQYRYHPNWTERRNETKFDRLASLCECVPLLRKKVEHDLKLPGLGLEKVVAAIVKVMLITQSRVGNTEYAESNESYGLTTLRNRHATVKGPRIKLAFKGKSGVEHDIDLHDPTLAKIISRCQELPGQELFGYLNEDGKAVDVTSGHVNDYLKLATGQDFTAKDLRMLGGSCKALSTLANLPEELPTNPRKLAGRHLSVIRETAGFLRNTVAVCRKYYIHPTIFLADQKDKIQRAWKSVTRAGKYETREEKVLLKILKA